MQCKLDEAERYCSINSLLINATKSLASIHGPLPNLLPVLTLLRRPLTYVETSKYVGISLCSTARDIFMPHYEEKAAAARRAANASLSLESYIGPLPPSIALTLYRARVEPHLTAGCEVALDVRTDALKTLEDIQLNFLRRALRVSPRAQTAALHSETGIWPLAFRRLALALRYLRYVLTDKPPLPYDALQDSWSLAVHAGAPSWWSDLHLVGLALDEPIHIPLRRFPTATSTTALLAQLHDALARSVERAVALSGRLPLLQRRLAHRSLMRRGAPIPLGEVCAYRAYLDLPTQRQREAITLLLLSEHPLAVERLRRQKTPPPRSERKCRFCLQPWAVEDETHTLLECDGGPLRARRDRFMEEASAIHRALPRLQFRLSSNALLDYLLQSETLLPLLATYVADVFSLCLSTPLLLPPDSNTRSPQGVTDRRVPPELPAGYRQ
ncbi:hypothetical protein C8Q77DRAFT_1067800 [Trametes polyzona]|nr:hypothetical protein C8Q77DRAFT_1067800 [Trametes polyzona]